MKSYGMDVRGKLWTQRISKLSYVPWTPNDIGRLIYDDDSDDIYFGANSEWKRPMDTSDLFNVNQEIVFVSAPLPVRWNIKPGVSGKTIMLTGDSNQIGTLGGAWKLSGIVASGSHIHFTPIGLGVPEESKYGPRTMNNNRYEIPYIYHKHEISAGGTHIHDFDGAWRPAYVLYAIGVFEG